MIKNQLLYFWGGLDYRFKKDFLFVLMTMILVAFAEVISLGAVIPFLAVISSPQNISESSIIFIIAEKVGVQGGDQIAIALTISFCSLALIASILRLSLIKKISRFSFDLGLEVSLKIYTNVLFQPYGDHAKRNSSKIINVVYNQTSEVIYGVVIPALNLISAIAISVVIAISLICIEPIAFLCLFSIFALMYLSALWITKNKQREFGGVIANQSSKAIQAIQEGLGGIRDITLDGTQYIFINKYKKISSELRKAQAGNLIISQSPRFLIETAGMIIISVFACVLSLKDAGNNLFITLGVIAIGAQKLLPLLQQAYTSWASVRSHAAILDEVISFYEGNARDSYGKTAPKDGLIFKDKIQFDKVSFSYDENKHVIQDLNLVISKGDFLGVIGKTGSGKSTFLDLLMGFQSPTLGAISVDGLHLDSNNIQYWQCKIAHVPQNIFLADLSFLENVAFGVPRGDIDVARVMGAIRGAQLVEFVNSLPNGLDTLVGEHGSMLSGGQRQRLGIARALYKNAELIIFDEGTSALDRITEEAVLESIQCLRRANQNLTVVMVSHNLEALKNCTNIIEMRVWSN